MTLNKKLLSEELKRHKRLLEYSFFVEDDDLEVATSADDKDKELLYDISEADPETDPEAGDPAAGGEDTGEDDGGTFGGEEGGDAEVDPAAGGEDDGGTFGDEEGGDAEGADAEVDPAAADTGDTGFGDAEAPVEDTGEEEVDIDVTQLVQSNEEAKQLAMANSQKMEELLTQFNQLSAQLGKMDAMTKKIDDLEHEVEKRNPTPQEKLEMRSLDSYPYNLKLTDFWAEKEGNYDAMGQQGKPKEQEYVLKQSDVDSDFNRGTIKKSFDDYKEEDVD